MHRLLLLLLLLLPGLASCTSILTTPDNSVCTNAPTISNAKGLLHGVACTANSQCKYGTCSQVALVLAGDQSLGVCTKNCSCGPNSGCSMDDDAANSLSFECVKQGVRSECALKCKGDADCQKVNPKLPFCIDSYPGSFTAGTKVCAAKAKP
jgi:hypothetical protein